MNTKSSKWIASIIEKSGLTMVEFARVHGLAYRTIQDLKLGNSKPSSPTTALFKRIEEEQNAKV